jgi:hypothetical protein
MKKIVILSLFLAVPTLSTFAQAAKQDPKPDAKEDSKGGPVLVAPQTIEKPKQEKKAPLNPPKMTNAVLGKTVVYGGYFTDLARAENKRAMFDLSAPLDPVKDSENVYFNSRPEQAHPFILFRIKF